jgi:hypothetical protein
MQRLRNGGLFDGQRRGWALLGGLAVCVGRVYGGRHRVVERESILVEKASGTTLVSWQASPPSASNTPWMHEPSLYNVARTPKGHVYGIVVKLAQSTFCLIYLHAACPVRCLYKNDCLFRPHTAAKWQEHTQQTSPSRLRTAQTIIHYCLEATNAVGYQPSVLRYKFPCPKTRSGL